MNANQKDVGRGFWLGWVLASAMGFGVGAIVGWIVISNLFGELFNPAAGLVFGALFGAAGGFLQWVVLRERIAKAGLWVIASSLAFAGAMCAAVVITMNSQNYTLAGFLALAVFGVIGGIMQGLVLKRAQIARAGWWVLANILGSLVGALGIPAVSVIGATGNYGLSTFAFGVLFGTGLGIITGAVLVWLLRQSHSSNIEGMATAH